MARQSAEKQTNFGMSVEVEPMEAKSAEALPTGTGIVKQTHTQPVANQTGGDSLEDLALLFLDTECRRPADRRFRALPRLNCSQRMSYCLI